MRIVSLLPSATEILFQLGLADQVVGVTFECDFPDAARQKRIVSTSALPEGLTPAEIDVVVKERMAAGEDLYRLDRGAFADLDPTLILTQDLCAVCAVDVSEVDDALAHLGCRADVLTLDPMTLDQVVDSVATVGAATQTEARAAEIVDDCRSRLAAVAAALEGAAARPTLVLEWTDPAFTAGHWVPDMVARAVASASSPDRVRTRSVSSGRRSPTAAPRSCWSSPCGFRLDGARRPGRARDRRRRPAAGRRGVGRRRRRPGRAARSARRRGRRAVRLDPPPRPHGPPDPATSRRLSV